MGDHMLTVGVLHGLSGYLLNGAIGTVGQDSKYSKGAQQYDRLAGDDFGKQKKRFLMIVHASKKKRTGHCKQTVFDTYSSWDRVGTIPLLCDRGLSAVSHLHT
jgi:hypothetical protein